MRNVISELDKIVENQSSVQIKYKGQETAIFLPSVQIESVLYSQGILNLELEDGHLAFDVNGCRPEIMNMICLRSEDRELLISEYIT